MNEFFRELGSKVLESAENARNAHDDGLFNEGYQVAWAKGLQLATMALYEAKVDEPVIIQLLQDYWDLDKETATRELRFVKISYYPQKQLRFYLSMQGWSPEKINEFIHSGDVHKRLVNDPTLCKLPIEKMMKKLQGNA